MRSDLSEGYSSLIEKLDQERPGHIDEIGRPLGGEFGVNGNQRHGVTAPHFGEEIDEETKRSSRQNDLFNRLAFLDETQMRLRAITEMTTQRATRLLRQFAVIFVRQYGFGET